MEQDAPARTARQEQGNRSREEILDAAERLMGARGYAATSIAALSKESGLPASSIYWHFGSKSGVLGAVMERGSRQFFALTDGRMLPQPGEPRERLAALLQLGAAVIDASPQFLRLLIILLLGSEGEHAQQEVVTRVRAEGARLLRAGLEFAYQPWGEDVAGRVGAELGEITLALFDGLFIASQASGRYEPALVDRAVTLLHTSAEAIRLAAGKGRPER